MMERVIKNRKIKIGDSYCHKELDSNFKIENTDDIIKVKMLCENYKIV